ncbi:MAG: ATP-dependent transcriptional regulator, partial [Chloroflexi bacterium]
MNTPLLLTKIHMPAVRTEFVPRPRLVNQLTAPGKLTLICAPAGFGKTTLASCWLAQKNQQGAWLSLDESDNDLHRFFTYFTIALQQIDATVGQNVLDTLQTPNPPAAPIFLSHLINDLAQSNQQFILVLDDYHLIDTEAIHNALTFLVENQPPQLHLVILSRTEPPLPITKLRAKNQIVTIQANDLRFTRAETETFFNQAMQLGLTGDQIAQLENQTEGWVTGLQLAALSLKETSDAVTFIRRLSGHDRYIADYLVNEVISYQPQHIQEFLLQTAVLKRMNADLCNVVLGITNSQSILETLETANLFIVPLDNNRNWYRYHHLFADTLQRQLERQNPERMIDLHRAAAVWFMAHDMLPESIEHSLEAKDYERVVQHLDEIIDQILASSRFKTYLRWLNKVPQTYLTPSIALYQLFFLHEMGEFDEAAKKLRLVEDLLGPLPQDIDELDAETAVYFGILAVFKGVQKASAFAVNEALPYFSQSLELLPKELIFWRALALGANGFCHRVNGNY